MDLIYKYPKNTLNMQVQQPISKRVQFIVTL